MAMLNKTYKMFPYGFTKRHIEIVELSINENYTVSIQQTKEGLWIIALQFEGKKEVHSIQTARGTMKVWRNIMSAISFVQQNCKSATDVFVEIADWKFSRINNEESSE